MKKIIMGVIAFAVFIILAVFAYNTLTKNTTPQSNIGVTENQGEVTKKENDKTKAPDFTVIDIDGNKVNLSEMIGKPIVLNFWASWCPPCKSEMPEFNKIYANVKDDVIFMMIDSVDGSRETVDKGKKYINDSGYTFPVYFDTKGQASYAYDISSLPTTFFIDKDGYIVTAAKGAINEKTLLKGINLIK